MLNWSAFPCCCSACSSPALWGHVLLLSFSSHFQCLQICHTGSCGDCPKSGSRTCPCGKSGVCVCVCVCVCINIDINSCTFTYTFIHVCSVPTPPSLGPPHPPCAHFTLSVPTPPSLCPLHTPWVHPTLPVPTSHSLCPPHPPCAHFTLPVPTSPSLCPPHPRCVYSTLPAPTPDSLYSIGLVRCESRASTFPSQLSRDCRAQRRPPHVVTRAARLFRVGSTTACNAATQGTARQ